MFCGSEILELFNIHISFGKQRVGIIENFRSCKKWNIE